MYLIFFPMIFFNDFFICFFRSQGNGSQEEWCWNPVHISPLVIKGKHSVFNRSIADTPILNHNWKIIDWDIEERLFTLCSCLLLLFHSKCSLLWKKKKKTGLNIQNRLTSLSTFCCFILVRFSSKNQNYSRYFKQKDL